MKIYMPLNKKQSLEFGLHPYFFKNQLQNELVIDCSSVILFDNLLALQVLM